MKIPAALLLLVTFAAGCRSSSLANVPSVRYENTEQAMEIAAARADAVKTISAPGLMTLRRPDGESVRFDVALARDDAGRLRLRAWKLGRAVFDLTMNDDGVYLLTPDDPSLKQKVRSAGVSARQLAETWNLFTRGDLFRAEDRQDRRVSRFERWLVCEVRQPAASGRASAGGDGGPVGGRAGGSDGGVNGAGGARGGGGGGTVRCALDTVTLVPLWYVMSDEQGRARFRLDLADYRMIGDLPFAHRYTATSDAGEILITLRDVELNGGLPPDAFKPPRRAEKLP